MPKQRLSIQPLAMWKRKLTKCPPCGWPPHHRRPSTAVQLWKEGLVSSDKKPAEGAAGSQGNPTY